MKPRKARAGASTPAKGKLARLFEEEDAKIEKKKKAGYMPLRFWLKQGDSQDIIILDNSLEDAFHIREHNLQGPDGKYGNFENCLLDSGEECPICKQYGEDSYLIAFLSVLVLKEWTSKKTGEVHKYSKMLLPIKRNQFGKFVKIDALAQKQHGTLRGTFLVMEREEADKSSAIGEPQPLEDGTLFDHYSEEDLVSEFGHKAIKSREGKILKEENEDTKVFDYLKLFPEQSKEELEATHGIESEPTPGSDEEEKVEFGEEDNMDMSPPEKSSDSSLAAIGALADTEEAETCPEIEAACEEADIDWNDFATWAEVGEKLDALKAVEKPSPKKKAAAKRRGRPKKVAAASDGGNVSEW